MLPSHILFSCTSCHPQEPICFQWVLFFDYWIVPWVFLECSSRVPQGFLEGSWSLSGVSPESPRSLPGVFLQCSLSVLRVFLEGSWSPPRVSPESPWSLPGVSLESPWTLHEIIKQEFIPLIGHPKVILDGVILLNSHETPHFIFLVSNQNV